MAVRRSDKLFGFRHSESREDFWKHLLQRVAQPEIEKVRQICVPDIVIVGRVSRYDFFISQFATHGVLHCSLTKPVLWELAHALGNELCCWSKATHYLIQNRDFRKIPGHRDCLLAEQMHCFFISSVHPLSAGVREIGRTVNTKRQIYSHCLGESLRAAAAFS